VRTPETTMEMKSTPSGHSLSESLCRSKWIYARRRGSGDRIVIQTRTRSRCPNPEESLESDTK
jgi:hypothetical protein